MVLHKQRFNCRKEPSKKRKAKFWLGTSAKSGKENERILKNFLFFFLFFIKKRRRKRKVDYLPLASSMLLLLLMKWMNVVDVVSCDSKTEVENKSEWLLCCARLYYLFINNKLKKKKNSWVWMWICDGVRMRAIEYLLIIINKRKKVPVQHHT